MILAQLIHWRKVFAWYLIWEASEACCLVMVLFCLFVTVGSQNFVECYLERSKTINSFLVLASDEFSTENREKKHRKICNILCGWIFEIDAI